MIIMESAIAMNNDYIECTNTLGKIDLFAEAAYKEYEINLKEVALKVLKENGTESDFDFLATEAATGYIQRAKNAIAKFIEAVKKFIRNCKDNLIKMVTNAKTNAAIDKVEDVCKANSKLRSKKVEYQDTDKQAGAIQQGIDRIRKKVAKIKAKGVATTEDIEEVEKIEADTLKKVAAITAVTTVTLATAIAIFKHCNSRSEVENVLDENAISDCEITIDEDTAKTAETAAFYTRSAGLLAKLKKEKASKKVVKSTSLLAAIKKSVSKAKGKIESEDLEGQAHESAIEDLAMFAYVAESAVSEEDEAIDETVEVESVDIQEGLDLDKYFTELCDDLFTNVTESTEEVEVSTIDNETEVEVEESAEVEVDATIDAVVYMEQLEREVFGEDEEVTTESESEETPEETSEETVTESTNDTEQTIQSLLDEMEALL